MAHLTSLGMLPIEAREEVERFLRSQGEPPVIINVGNHPNEYHVVQKHTNYGLVIKDVWTYVFCWQVAGKYVASVDVSDGSPEDVFKRLALRLA